jgi:hypothetical protein
VSEDWDDDFEFEEEMSLGSNKKDENRFSMVVPASIQAMQPSVKAYSGQIRELSLLVNDLKRLCRLGKETGMERGAYAHLWEEAQGIIKLASPDEDVNEAAEPEIDLAPSNESSRKRDGTSTDMNHRPLARRRSVFAPEDDIFGNWDQTDLESEPIRPRTPDNQVRSQGYPPGSVTRSVMEAMSSRQKGEDDELSNVKLNFDTNNLKELVKQASDLRNTLSDLVRKADRITQSPVRTPKRGERADGSPAFTRVFDEPPSSPTRRLTQSHSSNSGLTVGSVPSNGLSQRMQMMTVS